MKPNDDGNYFLTYANYPIISNKEKHIEFFDNKDNITYVWGVKITVGYLKQVMNKQGLIKIGCEKEE